MTTDELLEKMPDHLSLVKNSKADKNDRWRVYNFATDEYVKMDAKTAREALIKTLEDSK